MNCYRWHYDLKSGRKAKTECRDGPVNTMKRHIRCVVSAATVLLVLPGTVLAEASFDVTRLMIPPTIDGQIETSEWSGAAVIDQPFVQIKPDFGDESPYRTVVRISQTETALYVAFEAFDPDPSRISAARTGRDGGVERDDSVLVAIDTFGDERTAYYFRTNALATQEDGRIADNGRTVDDRWDAAWRSAAKRYEDRWTAEFEIPFSILKYSSGSAAAWRINFVRTVPRRLETSLWSGPGETVWRVSSFGKMSNIQLPAQGSDPWVFIPYALAALEEGEDVEVEAGIDVRWRPSTRFGVDLTLNPDFALVEADEEEINLSRFELRVPEKRPFFLEGNEMHQQRIRQFYSRRISDINWGVKASGKLGKADFSTIVTSENLDLADGIGEQTADYAVIRLQQSLAKGSNVGLLAANRSLGGDNAGSVGIDSTLFFTDTLGMTAQLLRVHGPAGDDGLAWFVRPAFDSSTSHFHVRYQELDPGIKDDFNAVGFLRDDDRREFDTNLSHTFWLTSGAAENIEASVNYNRYWSHEDVLRSWQFDASVEIEFRNGWEVSLDHVDEFKLFEKEFRNDRTVFDVGWSNRSGRSISVFAGSGFNFDSDLEIYGATVRWSVDEHLRFSYELTNLELEPDPDNESTVIHVLEALYSFNPDLFVKLFTQTNSVIDKENIQLLGVWRFQPPFGSLQVAYQRGTSDQGQESQQGNSFFTKLSWVF